MAEANPVRGRGLRVAGHPLHAALSAFPIAFLSAAPVLDGIALWRGGAFFWAASFWAMVVGVVAALPTLLAGLVDYATIASGERALVTATAHMVAMLAAVACLGGDLLLRGGPGARHGGGLLVSLVLDGLGGLVLIVGGWLGGELVFVHGVGRVVARSDPATPQPAVSFVRPDHPSDGDPHGRIRHTQGS